MCLCKGRRGSYVAPRESHMNGRETNMSLKKGGKWKTPERCYKVFFFLSFARLGKQLLRQIMFCS